MQPAAKTHRARKGPNTGSRYSHEQFGLLLMDKMQVEETTPPRIAGQKTLPVGLCDRADPNRLLCVIGHDQELGFRWLDELPGAVGPDDLQIDNPGLAETEAHRGVVAGTQR